MAFPLLPAATISLITLFIAYKLLQRLRFKLPPGPVPLPFVGNIFNINPVLIHCFTELSKTYGPIISVYLGTQLHVVVNSAELAKEVLKEKDHLLANRNRDRQLNKFFKNGMDLIWSDYGPHYVKVRKLCNLELFSMKRIEALRPIREDEVTAMVESIFNDCVKPENKGKPLVLREYLYMVALLHITRLSFGKRFMNSEGIIDEQGEEFKGILNDVNELRRKRSFAEYLPWLSFLFKAEHKALANYTKRLDTFLEKIFEENSLARKKTGNTKAHFTDALVTLQKEYDLSQDTVKGLIWDMITAGKDTTSITVEWALAEMVRNPRVQEKIQEELDRVIGTDRVMTEADIPNLPYLQCVVKECFRMHPPTPLLLPHRGQTNVKIGGFDIPKGATVIVNAWAIARDPKLWKEPLAFRPERFQEEDIDMKGNDYRLIPFGSGRRICPGAQLAINLVTSMLGHMLHHFTLTPPPGIKPEDIDMMELRGLVTYMRTPIEPVLTPRLSGDLFKRVAAEN